MTVEHGIALFLLGNCITVVFLFIAYHYGSKGVMKSRKLTQIEKQLKEQKF